MKTSINKIKGKRLVMGGGINLLTKDEILVTETPNGISLQERTSEGVKTLSGPDSSGNNNEPYYYYKVVGDVSGIIRDSDIFLNFCLVVEVIYDYDTGIYKKYTKNISYYGVEDLLYKLINGNCIAFKVLDIEITYFSNGLPLRGSMEDRIMQLVDFGVEESALKGVLDALHTAVVPITKEEYESLVTYKSE